MNPLLAAQLGLSAGQGLLGAYQAFTNKGPGFDALRQNLDRARQAEALQRQSLNQWQNVARTGFAPETQAAMEQAAREARTVQNANVMNSGLSRYGQQAGLQAGAGQYGAAMGDIAAKNQAQWLHNLQQRDSAIKAEGGALGDISNENTNLYNAEAGLAEAKRKAGEGMLGAALNNAGGYLSAQNEQNFWMDKEKSHQDFLKSLYGKGQGGAGTGATTANLNPFGAPQNMLNAQPYEAAQWVKDWGNNTGNTGLDNRGLALQQYMQNPIMYGGGTGNFPNYLNNPQLNNPQLNNMQNNPSYSQFDYTHPFNPYTAATSSANPYFNLNDWTGQNQVIIPPQKYEDGGRVSDFFFEPMKYQNGGEIEPQKYEDGGEVVQRPKKQIGKTEMQYGYDAMNAMDRIGNILNKNKNLTAEERQKLINEWSIYATRFNRATYYNDNRSNPRAIDKFGNPIGDELFKTPEGDVINRDLLLHDQALENEWKRDNMTQNNFSMPPIPKAQHGGEVHPPTYEYNLLSNVLSQRNKHLNWVERGLNPEKYPKIINKDGSESTHRLSYSTGENGKAYVYPHIIQNEKGELQELSDNDAWNYALKTNTAMEVPNAKLALYYSQNGLIKHEQGGKVKSRVINIEGGEILVDAKGKPVKTFSAPMHPALGLNDAGDRNVPIGHFVVPKKDAEFYTTMWNKGNKEKCMKYLNSLD